MFIKRIALFSIIITTPVFARVIKTEKISTVCKEVKKYHKQITKNVSKKKKLMVIFDIDNTLAEPDNLDQYGSDQWLQTHVERIVEKGIPTVKAWDIMLPLWFEIQKDPKFSLRPVEKNTVEIFKDIQKLSDKTIGLTARSFPILSDTLRLLKHVGINFLDNGFTEDFMFDGVPGEYTHGIFFCGTGDKGESLLELFARLNYYPDIIIFVDDKEKNVQSVEKAALLKNIEFLGIHYTHLEIGRAHV